MKTRIGLLLLAGLFIGQNAYAQSAKPVKHARHVQTMIKTDTSASYSSTEETSMNPGAAPGDPLNLNHPFFNGEARWTNADSLYTHGDFPWAMVQQHPESFNFDAQSGRWEVLSTSGLSSQGKSR